MTNEIRRPIQRCPSHPGALLDDIIPATGKTKVEIANLLGFRGSSFRHHQRKEAGIANVAARLGKLFGDGAGVGLECRLLMTHGRPRI